MKQTNLENSVLVSLIALGVGSGIYFRTIGDNQLSAVLFSLAFASVLYKFLGGAQEDNSLSIGVIKFGGSAAVLGGFIWLLSQVIFVDSTAIGTTPISSLDIKTIPAQDWYAADTKTGAPINVKLYAADTIVDLPLHKVRQDKIYNRRFQLSEFEEEHFYVLPIGSQGDTLGQVYLTDIIGNSLQKQKSDVVVEDAFVFMLYPNIAGKRSSSEIELNLMKRGQRETTFPFPFIIKSYGTLFSIKNRVDKTPIISDGEIKQKTPIIIPEIEEDGTKNYWVLYSVHANFLNPDETQHYTEWVVHKVSLQ